MSKSPQNWSCIISCTFMFLHSGSAISPDYTLTSTSEDISAKKPANDKGMWIPETADVSKVHVSEDLASIIMQFAEHFHDSWATRKVNMNLFDVHTNTLGH